MPRRPSYDLRIVLVKINGSLNETLKCQSRESTYSNVVFWESRERVRCHSSNVLILSISLPKSVQSDSTAVGSNCRSAHNQVLNSSGVQTLDTRAHSDFDNNLQKCPQSICLFLRQLLSQKMYCLSGQLDTESQWKSVEVTGDYPVEATQWRLPSG